jgi:hypothetical protein
MKTGAERGELLTLLDEPYLAFLLNYLPSPPSAPAFGALSVFLSFFHTIYRCVCACQIFEVGACSTDGALSVVKGHMRATRGHFSLPFCPIKGALGGCLDLEGEGVVPGTKLIGWGCGINKWNQVRVHARPLA